MNLINFLADGVSCGGLSNPIPFKLVYVIHMIIMLIQFGVPLLLIIFGMLDLGKAVIASKEDEIKKGQQMFIKRLIAAVIVFFVIAVVKFVPNSGAVVCIGGRRRPGGRPDDVMSDLSAARTTTRFGQCRESRARKTHEFARSAGRAARTKPTTPDCQP